MPGHPAVVEFPAGGDMQRSDAADGEGDLQKRQEYGVDADIPDSLPPTSRICVKNLPKHVDESRLKEHFSAKGEVTDAKVMRTSDGRSRCFGFIGFRGAEEAEAAVKYFNKTFMDTMRLVVEFAYKYGPPAERPQQPWSKYTDGTSANKRVKAATGANGVRLGEGPAASLTAREAKKKAKEGRERKPEEEDPKLQEFMALMQPRSKQAIWSNDDIVAAATAAPQLCGRTKATAAREAEQDEVEDGGSEDELYQDLPETDGAEEQADDGAEARSGDALVTDAGVSDMDYLLSRVRRDFDADDAALSSGESESEDGLGSSSATDEDEAQAAGGDSGSEGEEGGGRGAAVPGRPAGNNGIDSIFDAQPVARLDASGAAPSGRESAALPHRGTAAVETDDGAAEAAPEVVIAETGRLFVRNLPYTAAEEDLRAAFEPYGEVEEAHVVLDKATRQSKGFALVQFARAEEAVVAHEALDGSIFMGRLLHVLPGKRAPAPAPVEAGAADADARGGGTSSYKRQRDSELKASAGNRAAWNSLFMRADTVAEAVAAHYGVTKAELLDPQAADMAVRLALGETHIIAETKAALSDAGVDVTSLEAAAASAARGKAAERGGGGMGADVARSERALVVKNLPFSASEADLELLFGGVGPLARLVLPPTRTLALVEFVEAQDARRAFQSLAYKRYEHVPLYLEWAPAGIFNKPASAAKVASKAAAASKAAPAATAAAAAQDAGRKKGGKEGKAPAALAAGLGAAEAEDDAVESSTIYVKNLAFATTDAALALHFEAAAAAAGGSLHSAKVAKRRSSDGKMLSAGFGFVECSNEGVARAAIKALQGSSLDGHKLVLQLSQAQGRKEGKGGALGSGAQETTKVVVRNVAFEATRKDILGLFTPFGHVRSCRLPRKFDGSHRGFAFVDFSTRAEARAAVEAVAGTHLYGRRLVIEWAEEEGGLEELRSKTAAKYRGEAAALLQGGGRGAEEEAQEGGDGGRGEVSALKKRRRGRGE